MLAGLAGLAFAGLAGACSGGDEEGAEIDGAEVYEELCARCHGPEGEPTPGMVARHGVRDLTAREVQAEMTDEEIREQIFRGSKNREMPSFGGVVSDEEVGAVIDYVREFGEAPR